MRPHSFQRQILSWLLLAVLGCGCERGRAPAPDEAAPQEAVTAPSPPAQLDPDQLRALERLGYVDYEPDPSPAAESGVVHHEAGRSQPGYRLYSAAAECRADLVDLEGEVVRSWSLPTCWSFEHPELTPGGDLVAPVKTRAGTLLVRFSWEGDVLWQVPMLVHHDVEPQQDGGFLALTELPEARKRDPSTPLFDNAVAWVDGDGRLLRQLWLGALLGLRGSEDDPQKDSLHANSVESIPETVGIPDRSPLRPGLLLVSLRNQDNVVLVDPDAERITWSWGEGVLDQQHDAHVLGDGDLTVFDNGTRRGWSRVLEVDPRTRSIVWSYGDPDPEHPEHFFSATLGGAQRLPNGNTLVTCSNRGWAFEITPEGRRVWSFFTPYRNPRGKRAAITRMRHYDPEFIEALVAGSGPRAGPALP